MMLMRREIGTEANFKADHRGRVRHVKAFGQVLVVVRKVTLVELKMELRNSPSQDFDVPGRTSIFRKPMRSPRCPRTIFAEKHIRLTVGKVHGGGHVLDEHI